MALDGKLAFIETNSDLGDSSLWVSDGTAGGTTEVTSFPSQGQNYGGTPTMAELNGDLYISAPAPIVASSFDGYALYKSDGTAAGTTIVTAAPQTATPSDLTVYRGKLYFAASSSTGTPLSQVWATDGTAAGTKLVANVGPAYAFIDQLLAAGPNLYIFVYDNQSTNALPTSLYRSNGTAKGTVLIHYFPNDFPVATAVLPNGDLAFNVSGTPPRLWLTNGTVAGTTVVKDLGGGFGYSSYDGNEDNGSGDGALAPIDGRFFIDGQSAKYPNALWQSNGTVAGTTLVQDFSGSQASMSYADPLTELNGHLIVAADDATHGLELWSGPMPPAPKSGKVTGK
jgi:ELWxxDGT repeat protein